MTKIWLSEEDMKIIELKQKGCSDREVAEKLNVTRQAITKRVKKMKELGLYDSEYGNPISVQEISGKRPQLKGAVRCPYCKKALIPINEVTLNPVEMKAVLVQHGFSHICIDCKKAFTRETTEQSGFTCAECGNDVIKVSYKGAILYFCNKCKALYDKDELKEETGKQEKAE